MAIWPHLSAKHTTDDLRAGVHAGSEDKAGFTSRESRSTGGRASRLVLTQTSCVKGGTHSKRQALTRSKNLPWCVYT